MADDNREFLGRGWRFPPTFDADGAQMVAAEQDIRESLLILIATIRGERVMRPDYGLGLYADVFIGTDRSTLTFLEGQIRSAIRRFEPRIRIEVVSIDARDSIDGRLMISLEYTVRSTNSRSNMVFPFGIHEGTNLRAG